MGVRCRWCVNGGVLGVVYKWWCMQVQTLNAHVSDAYQCVTYINVHMVINFNSSHIFFDEQLHCSIISGLLV